MEELGEGGSKGGREIRAAHDNNRIGQKRTGRRGERVGSYKERGKI